MSNLPAISMKQIESSQIHSIGHDPVNNILAIRFKSKGEPAALYHYKNVSADDYAAFSGAESIGSHFYRNIKPDTDRYPFQRINEKKDGE
ncbi:KTSC domain-containing protein [Yersinia enterocolitica]|uniref:KTSC domain-containing protein n=1 Tax=Yersinia TaxID=629 RepID=UPI0005E96292|nr:MULTISPECIES: KTSC domain-containing protein [Yersinia]EKN3943111.1 KTSC domain-containing protein [Yersinia enterocolitica]EKN4800082.1 KTSC domain-containing protein [Yersinia enterocolitica]EKN6254624.1 KTSC domain-containing protein [Yersinia enterocolitica]UYK17047.1 KTSC domain-containing protein [Yersinia enterocolitica]WET13921.1 KTSC domain-containing protein [Yersinia intermedia]